MYIFVDLPIFVKILTSNNFKQNQNFLQLIFFNCYKIYLSNLVFNFHFLDINKLLQIKKQKLKCLQDNIFPFFHNICRNYSSKYWDILLLHIIYQTFFQNFRYIRYTYKKIKNDSRFKIIFDDSRFIIIIFDSSTVVSTKLLNNLPICPIQVPIYHYNIKLSLYRISDLNFYDGQIGSRYIYSANFILTTPTIKLNTIYLQMYIGTFLIFEIIKL